jgi:hypothetical protein
MQHMHTAITECGCSFVERLCISRVCLDNVLEMDSAVQSECSDDSGGMNTFNAQNASGAVRADVIRKRRVTRCAVHN